MSTNYRKLFWTEHSKIKMKQYGLSVSKLLGILRKPERKELGIVPGTTAVMRTNPAKSKKVPLPFLDSGASKKFTKWQPKKAPGEIWLMFKDVKQSGENIRKIISAWRYPGISKPGEAIPIPDDIRKELMENC